MRRTLALLLGALAGCTIIAPFDDHPPFRPADADADADSDADTDADADADGDADADAGDPCRYDLEGLELVGHSGSFRSPTWSSDPFGEMPYGVVTLQLDLTSTSAAAYRDLVVDVRSLNAGELLCGTLCGCTAPPATVAISNGSLPGPDRQWTSGETTQVVFVIALAAPFDSYVPDVEYELYGRRL